MQRIEYGQSKRQTAVRARELSNGKEEIWALSYGGAYTRQNLRPSLPDDALERQAAQVCGVSS